MAIGTTAALLIGSGLAAGAQAYGAHKQASAAKDATRAQTAANDAALAYAREQEARNRADYERALAQWNAGRASLLERYGVSVPALTAPQATSGAGFRATAPLSPGALVSAGTAQIPNQTLAGIMAEREAAMTRPGRWNDWESYGLQQA
jgi:hypothetical protein